MRALWTFLQGKRNREILAWLGGGAVIMIGGIWAAFVYLFPPGGSDNPPSPDCTIEANSGIAACGDQQFKGPVSLGSSTGKN